jgi:hypothetical protein
VPAALARSEDEADLDAAADRTQGDAVLARAREHYQRAIRALREEGNWGLYGEEMRRLGEILGQPDGRP